MKVHHEEKEMSIEEYITEKIRMLKDDFFVNLTEVDEMHLKSLKRDIDVDRYAHDLIMNKLR